MTHQCNLRVVCNQRPGPDSSSVQVRGTRCSVTRTRIITKAMVLGRKRCRSWLTCWSIVRYRTRPRMIRKCLRHQSYGKGGQTCLICNGRNECASNAKACQFLCSPESTCICLLLTSVRPAFGPGRICRCIKRLHDEYRQLRRRAWSLFLIILRAPHGFSSPCSSPLSLPHIFLFRNCVQTPLSGFKLSFPLYLAEDLSLWQPRVNRPLIRLFLYVSSMSKLPRLWRVLHRKLTCCR